MAGVTTAAPPGGVSSNRSAAILALTGVLTVSLLGLGLRLGMETARWWFTGDEGIYLQVATTALTERAQEVIHKNAHPPLHYWILRLAAPWVHDPANLRLISLVAGWFGILAAGWLGWESATGKTRWGRVAGAWFGSVMVALAPGLIVQAATLRPYALCVFVLTAGLASLLRYLTGGRTRWLVVFSVGLTVAVLLLYSSFLVALALGLLLLGALLAGRLSRKQFATLLAAGAPAMVAMAWLLATHIRPQLLGSGMHRRATDLWLHDQFAHGLFQALRLLQRAVEFSFSNTLAWLVLLPALLAAVLSVARRRGALGILLLLQITVTVACSLAGLLPLGPSRHSLYLVPVFVAASASALAWTMEQLSPTSDMLPQRPRRLAPWLMGGLATLFVVPVGLTLRDMARAGLYATLGATRREFVVTRELLATVKTFVQKAPVEAWLTDVQTSMLLIPLASPENRVLTPETSFAGAHLDVLGRRLAVVKSWQLPESPAPQNDPVEAALAWLEPVATRGNGQIGLVIGGWGNSAAYRLATTLRASGQAAVVAVGDASLAAVLVAPAALRSWRAIQKARQTALSR